MIINRNNGIKGYYIEHEMIDVNFYSIDFYVLREKTIIQCTFRCYSSSCSNNPKKIAWSIIKSIKTNK